MSKGWTTAHAVELAVSGHREVGGSRAGRPLPGRSLDSGFCSSIRSTGFIFSHQPISDDGPPPSHARWLKLLHKAAAAFAEARRSGEIEDAELSLQRLEMRLDEAFVRGLTPKA
jgi:hypothetical protein